MPSSTDSAALPSLSVHLQAVTTVTEAAAVLMPKVNEGTWHLQSHRVPD